MISSLSSGGGDALDAGRSALAEEHGHQRLVLGVHIDEVVREYGQFFESILEVATTERVTFSMASIAELQRCLNVGAASAATRFAKESEAARQRRDFEHFAFLAHEIRNPLSSVRLAWDAMCLEDTRPPSRAAEVLSRNLKRLAELIDHSLVDIKLRQGADDELVREPVPLRELLDDVRDEVAADASGKQVTVTIDACPTVDGDHRLLRSALTNLVRNAIKFSTAGGAVNVRCRRREGRVLIEVADTCGGIDPSKIEGVFEAFGQAHKNRSRFGLGLAIAKEAIEAHGGTISVHNAPPVGCVFLVDLPG
ncbi:MAG: HAMP domain-containing histidine kinase [Myxococcota bacterium]|nr:HAMP domain-containing histidine kinase [Myxococcota bacterium]